MPRLIDGDALLEQMKHRKEYVGRPSDPVCLVEDAPTVGNGMAEALDCYRREHSCLGETECEQTKCKWRCDGRAVGLDYGYCAANNLLADIVRLLGGEPGKGATLRVD